MALNPNALVEIVEARKVLGLYDSTKDDAVELAINRVSDLVENTYCLRPIKQQPRTLWVKGTCWPEIRPREHPIDTTGAVSVTLNGIVQTVWKGPGDGDSELMDVHVYPDHFYRHEGWTPTGRTATNVQLIFDGGYDPVPDGIQVAALEIIAKVWSVLEQQRPDFASMSGPGGAIVTLDGQWSAAQSDQGAWSLSRRAKEVLESYRWRNP